MWFVWGTKNTRTRVGVVADYCPLCYATHPTLPELEHNQREWVRKLRAGETHGRAHAITGPLFLVAVAFERRKSAMKLGFVSWLVLFATAVIVSVWTGVALSTLSPDLAVCLIPAAIFGALFLALVVDRATDTGRYVKKVTYPAIRRSLTPLRPSIEELGAAQAQLTQMKLRLAKRLHPTDVQRVLTS